MSKGLTVIEGDAEKDLAQFPDSSFDFVILSQTLQAFLDPEKVISRIVTSWAKKQLSLYLILATGKLDLHPIN